MDRFTRERRKAARVSAERKASMARHPSQHLGPFSLLTSIEASTPVEAVRMIELARLAGGEPDLIEPPVDRGGADS